MGPRAGLDGRKISLHRDSIPDRPALSQSLYRLSYRAHVYILLVTEHNGVASPEKKSVCLLIGSPSVKHV